jgi:hypothetical protein
MPAKKTTKKRAAPARKKPATKKPAKKAELKTKKTAASVDGFIAKQDAARRDDCKAIDALFERVVGEKGKMWGASIIGYGSRTLTYPSGRTLDWMLAGFSPRKQNLTLYLTDGFAERASILKQLGPVSTGKSCLYIKRLADVDPVVLEELVQKSIAAVRAQRA